MAEFVRGFGGKRVVIDHHVTQDDLGAQVFKDTSAEATGILVMRAARALGATITPDFATGLFTAIAMDTGWFRHANTHAGTLRSVAELIDAGAPIADIYRDLFERNTVGRMKLMGQTLSSLRTDLGGRVAYATISLEDLIATGALPQDSEDLVDYTVSLRGVDVGLLFIEQACGGVKISIRSRNGLDCSRLASLFGGGGHKKAAGVTFAGPLAESVREMLAAVRQTLEEPGQTG
jgi:phosphoesterase RecJ-like protein